MDRGEKRKQGFAWVFSYVGAVNTWFVYDFCEGAVRVIGKKPARRIDGEELVAKQPRYTYSDLICQLSTDEVNTLILMLQHSKQITHSPCQDQNVIT